MRSGATPSASSLARRIPSWGAEVSGSSSSAALGCRELRPGLSLPLRPAHRSEHRGQLLPSTLPGTGHAGLSLSPPRGRDWPSTEGTSGSLGVVTWWGGPACPGLLRRPVGWALCSGCWGGRWHLSDSPGEWGGDRPWRTRRGSPGQAVQGKDTGSGLSPGPGPLRASFPRL